MQLPHTYAEEGITLEGRVGHVDEFMVGSNAPSAVLCYAEMRSLHSSTAASDSSLDNHQFLVLILAEEILDVIQIYVSIFKNWTLLSPQF